MPRKRCCGWVEELPECRRFTPDKQGNKKPALVSIEELEALRLKDVEGLEQADGAQAMGMTRPTFQRLLQRARQKIALALVTGQTIQIEGGNYMVKNRVFECMECSHSWEVEPCSEGGKHGYEIACPQCGSLKKYKLNEEGPKHSCGGQHGGCCGGHHGHHHHS